MAAQDEIPASSTPGDAPEPSVDVRTLEAFADAWNRHDVDALMAFMTDDCEFLTAIGAADGVRVEVDGVDVFTFVGTRIRVKDSYRKQRTG